MFFVTKPCNLMSTKFSEFKLFFVLFQNEVVEQIQEQWRKQIKDAFLERKSLERLRAYSKL
jgi:hypothetical protein